MLDGAPPIKEAAMAWSPIEPRLVIRVKYFGRHKGGAIRDGVLVALVNQPQTRPAMPAWSCDTDAVIAANAAEL
jgi:hypothetical protein